MKSAEFNKNYEIDRRSKGVKATAKHAAAEVPEILTADGTVYDADQTYHFFDEPTQQIRQSLGLRRSGEHLCTFGLRVVAVSKLRARKDDALADGQKFFNAEIEHLRTRIRKYEAEKQPANRSLKAVLTSR